MSDRGLDKPTLVLIAHLVVGLGLVGLGAYRVYAFGSVVGPALNVAVGLVVMFVGYRLSKLL